MVNLRGASSYILGQEPLPALCLGLHASGSPLPDFQMPINHYFISVVPAPHPSPPSPHLSQMTISEIGSPHKEIGATEAEEGKAMDFLLFKHL